MDKIRFVVDREELQKLFLGISTDCMSKIRKSWVEIKSTKLLGFMLFFKSPIVFKDTKALQGIRFFFIDFPKPSNLSSPRWKIFNSLQKLTKIKVGEENFM